MLAEYPPILPDSSSPYEAAHGQVSAWRWDRIDVDILRRVRDPWLCPERLLPFLAYQRSVDIWDPDWPAQKKRAVIAAAPEDHRLKGTLAGIERYLRHADVELISAIVPPDKTFLMPGFSSAERQSWLDRFPQLRMYPYAAQAQQQFKTFTTAAMQRSKHFLGDGHPMDAATYSRYRRIARLYEPRDGSLADLTVRSTKSIIFRGDAFEQEEVILPEQPNRFGLFLDDAPRAQTFLAPPDYVAERVITLRTEKAYQYRVGQSQYNTVSPGWQPVEVRPEGVVETGSRNGAQLIAGDVLHGRFLPASTAWQRIYERIYLHDPSRLPNSRPRSMHLGHTRLGMPAYHAELKIAVRNRRPNLAVNGYTAGHLYRTGTKRLDLARSAVVSAKAHRDKILINTKTRRPIQAGDPIVAGQYRFGDLIAT